MCSSTFIGPVSAVAMSKCIESGVVEARRALEDRLRDSQKARRFHEERQGAVRRQEA